MRHERVVELLLGGKSEGSGYLISSRHVLTARHVLGTRVKPGRRCLVRPLLSNRPDVTGARFDLSATVGWLPADPRLDIAVVTLDRPMSGLPKHTGFARVARGDARPWPFSGTGFPLATGTLSHGFFGRLTEQPDGGALELNIESADIKKAENWGGASGTVLFCEGRAVGVVETVDTGFCGRLTATPLHRLFSDLDFPAWWMQQGEAPSVLSLLGDPPEAPVDQIVAQLHHLNREPAFRAAYNHLKAVLAPAAAVPVPTQQLLVLLGDEQDLHDKLILRLATSPEIQRLLRREAPPGDVILQLPWPELASIEEPEQALADVVAPLFRSAGLEAPVAGESDAPALLSALARKLDERVSPCSFWALLKRGQARHGHGSLLRRMLEFWVAVPTRRPAFLFLCVALDEPPPPEPRRFNWLKSAPPNEDLHRDLDTLLPPLQSRLAVLPPLEVIRTTDIGRWVSSLKSSCRGLSAIQLELFGAALQTRLSPSGMALRPLMAELPRVFGSIQPVHSSSAAPGTSHDHH